jgi:DNA-binding transcriptional LysR family regulator
MAEMYDLRQIRAFRTVAAERSFTRAARALNYAQSSITAQIRGIEDDLGVPLFDRMGRRVELTAAGRRFLGYAERMLELADEARLAARGSAEPAGPLRISAPESLLTYRLPRLLRAFQRRHPAVQLSLEAAGHLTAADPLDPRVDLALAIDEPIRSPQAVVARLRVEPMVVAVSANHPLAGRKRIGVAELADRQFLLADRGCSYRSLFDRTLAASGARVSHFLEFASVEAIKQCGLAGMGIAVLPEVVVSAELKSGALVALPWPNPRMHVSTQILRDKKKWFSPVMQAFWAMAVAEIGAPMDSK